MSVRDLDTEPHTPPRLLLRNMPRLLHYVFKVAHRPSTVKFYRDVLGMSVLRHEEFTKACDAACNGPYDGKWSKTMLGYGPESTHFSVELTYNYDVKEYRLGNGFKHITIHSREAFERVRKAQPEFRADIQADGSALVTLEGYKFVIVDADAGEGKDPARGVTLGVSDLARSLAYWSGTLGMQVFTSEAGRAVLTYGANQAVLELVKQASPVVHAEAYGRVAFSVPRAELPGIQKKAEDAGQKVLTPLISLDTPGKATVEVVILADPDGYEICFVGEEAFGDLSKVDPDAANLLNSSVESDHSDAHFQKKKAAELKAKAEQEVAEVAEAKALASKMTYHNLGHSGLRVSRFSYGAWVTFGQSVDANAAYELMKCSYLHGINLFDNAETYGAGKAEEIMGKAIQIGIEKCTWTREDLVITTKLFFGTVTGPNNKGLSRKHIIEGCKASLKRLSLDYVDILYCHRPDLMTPIEETVRAMNYCIEQGWALYWGTSEWSATEIMDACRAAERLGLINPIVEQPQYNLFERDRVEMEYRPLYKSPGIGLTTWSPLSSGILSGKYSGKALPEGSRLAIEQNAWLRKIKLEGQYYQVEKADALKPIAEEVGCSLAQLCIAWCALNPNVTNIILGASSIAQLKENIKAIEVVPKLTPAIVEKIEAVVGTKPQLHRIHQQVTTLRQWPPSS